jgi:hypothetical protein
VDKSPAAKLGNWSRIRCPLVEEAGLSIASTFLFHSVISCGKKTIPNLTAVAIRLLCACPNLLGVLVPTKVFAANIPSGRDGRKQVNILPSYQEAADRMIVPIFHSAKVPARCPRQNSQVN